MARVWDGGGDKLEAVLVVVGLWFRGGSDGGGVEAGSGAWLGVVVAVGGGSDGGGVERGCEGEAGRGGGTEDGACGCEGEAGRGD